MCQSPITLCFMMGRGIYGKRFYLSNCRFIDTIPYLKEIFLPGFPCERLRFISMWVKPSLTLLVWNHEKDRPAINAGELRAVKCWPQAQPTM